MQRIISQCLCVASVRRSKDKFQRGVRKSILKCLCNCNGETASAEKPKHNNKKGNNNMKKLMMMTVGVLALGAVAQEVEIPAPIAMPTVMVTSDAVELKPGALCKTYYYSKLDPYAAKRDENVSSYEEWLTSAIPVDQSYDEKSGKFDGKNVAKHSYNIAKWEGIFTAKTAGRYVFTVNSGFCCSVDVNGQGFKGTGQGSFYADLRHGSNKITIWRVVYPDWADTDYLTIDYRLASSTKGPKPIMPSMLMHVDEDEEDW